MRTFIVRDAMRIPIGRQGENEAQRVVWPDIVTSWAKLYGDGVFSLAVKRKGDTAPYPVTVTTEDGALVWVPTNADTAVAGSGSCELSYTVDNVLAKSQMWSTEVYSSLTGEGETEPPEPYQSWVDAVLATGTAAGESAAQAAASAEQAEAAAKGSAESAQAAEASAEEAGKSAESAGGSSTSAEEDAAKAEQSRQAAAQALADLLAMLGSDIAPLVNGVIPIQYIPATATTEIYEVTSEAELISLTAQRGDLAELVETVDGERTITKTWQLLGDDASKRSDWVVWGTSYAVSAGNAALAANAENAAKINNHRMVEMTAEAFASAVKDPDTYYLVYPEAAT